MKAKIHKTIIFILFFLLLACSVRKKDTVAFKLEHQILLSRDVEMRLPIPFHTQKENYEEGIFCVYSFTDSAYIIVFQGALMEFPIDRYKVQKTEIKNNKNISIGVENNKCWRKDIFEGVSIYYDNVLPEKKDLYDKILDELKINPIK